MQPPPTDLDVLIIGAGLAGLAIGRELAGSGLRVAVIDSADQPASETSARNSGVIHAGFYYATDSLKARLCAPGSIQLRRYCQQRQVPMLQCGKLVLAHDEAGEERLSGLKAQGEINGVDGLQIISGDQARQHGAGIQCRAALWSAQTAIVDSHALASTLAQDLQAASGMLVLRTCFAGARQSATQWQVRLSDPDGEHVVSCHTLINCAGLHASAVANRIHANEAMAVPQTRYARGNYFTYHGRAPADTLLYPLPEQDGLGIHLTLDLQGRARFGPDVEWVASPGTRVNESRRPDFEQAIARYLPALDLSRLAPAWAGTRPKAFDGNTPVNDFFIGVTADRQLVQLAGIESPGLTCVLSLAEHVRQLVT